MSPQWKPFGIVKWGVIMPMIEIEGMTAAKDSFKIGVSYLVLMMQVGIPGLEPLVRVRALYFTLNRDSSKCPTFENR
jgi:hypothetical protein